MIGTNILTHACLFHDDEMRNFQINQYFSNQNYSDAHSNRKYK